MPKKPNFRFERQQRDKAKAAKKAAKANAKAEAKADKNEQNQVPERDGLHQGHPAENDSTA